MNRSLLPLFVLCCVTIVLPQSDNEWRIRLLQDQRVESSGELATFLKEGTPRERELALLAIANIQDTGAVDLVAPLLADDEPKVRSMAGFALGMINKPRCANLLLRRITVERDDKVASDLIAAVGLCASADDLKKLVAQADDLKAEWRPALAQAIARCAVRKVKDPAATKLAAAMMADNPTILYATYALGRTADTAVIRQNRVRLIGQMSNTSSIVRMWSANCLAVLSEPDCIAALSTAAVSDKDWRVRVNALRALRKRTSARDIIRTAAADSNSHVALTALSSYRDVTASESSFTDSSYFLAMLTDVRTAASVREEVRTLIAERMGERALPVIGPWKGTTPTISAQRVRSIGATASVNAVPILKEALQQSPHSLVTIAAIEAYQQIAARAGEQMKREFLTTVTTQFRKKDPGISYTAAVAFQDTSFSVPLRTVFLSALISEFSAMRSPKDLEAMVEMLKVFAALGDTTALTVIRPVLSAEEKVLRTEAEKTFHALTEEELPEHDTMDQQHVRPWFREEDRAMLAKFNGATVFTKHGTIEMTFDKEAAPLTVLNFILLAQKKFFDGLSFHRVVSNFVVQGGDPAGNGSGGPDYAIRTEVYPYSKFKSGAVGMASAGKDTEGSQWFITHTPTPHLDYRYTVFAYTPDAAVIDRIMVGDLIERVVLN